ncbi:conserved hypothetical protein [Neospora caninum Liverpool]|uniref:Ribosomal RNA methyltransferase FtsJ domain-containing protein n=1 Tax=Neospora caninum (strain Liverpool) TaxID=572307 RepID=F0VPM9_NEOCL|nr:conserved hypothetical protein [Neospora caninum Liverpool]CBZ55676.1 conserved hypothetical protein [Neospora caninum Liverpool]|eukprot:XP_003885702.1 conserved hypothetical protein [Neospora caninum Liverpool]
MKKRLFKSASSVQTDRPNNIAPVNRDHDGGNEVIRVCSAHAYGVVNKYLSACATKLQSRTNARMRVVPLIFRRSAAGGAFFLTASKAPVKRIRADDLLVQQGIAETRSQAASLILLGHVAVATGGKRGRSRDGKTRAKEDPTNLSPLPVEEPGRDERGKDRHGPEPLVCHGEEGAQLQAAILLLRHSPREHPTFVTHHERLQAWHRVLSSGHYRLLTKAGEPLRLDAAETPSLLLRPQPRFVNRAGEKLEAFLSSVSARSVSLESPFPPPPSSASWFSSPHARAPSAVAPSVDDAKTSRCLPGVGRRLAHEACGAESAAKDSMKETTAAGNSSETDRDRNKQERREERNPTPDPRSARGRDRDLPICQWEEERDGENEDASRDQTVSQVIHGFSGEGTPEKKSDIFSLEGKTVLDVGSSTGGFTDCCLQRGAGSVVCVDVGRGELHVKLRSDPRVVVREGVNARYLTAEDVGHEAFDCVLVDLSFISLKKVLERVWSFVKQEGLLILLVKPQFEVTLAEATRFKGVIKDPEIRSRVISEIRSVSLSLAGCEELASQPSAVRGKRGNIEHFLAFRKVAPHHVGDVDRSCVTFSSDPHSQHNVARESKCGTRL